MALLDVHHRRFHSAIGMLLLGAVLAPRGGFPQPASEPAADDELHQRALEQIEAVRAQNGPFSTELIEPLTALAVLYQEHGNHPLARTAIDEARQIVRANHGLYSFAEVPLLRLMLRSEEAMGNFEAAWNLEQELLILTKRHPSDLRTVPILREIAGRRMDVLDRYLDGGFPPEIVLGCYYATPLIESDDPQAYKLSRNCASGSNLVVVRSILNEVQSYYIRAIVLLLGNGPGSDEQLMELERDFLFSSYLFREYEIKPELDVRKVLHSILDYRFESSASALNRAATLVQLADWDLLSAHDRNRFQGFESVLDIYREAYRQLEGDVKGQQSIEEFFSPRMPVVLPSFLPNPLTAERAAELHGYIDVSFDITKFGTSENIEVLETSPNVSRMAEKEIVRQIRRSSFRPRVTDGRFAEASPVVVRYHLND